MPANKKKNINHHKITPYKKCHTMLVNCQFYKNSWTYVLATLGFRLSYYNPIGSLI